MMRAAERNGHEVFAIDCATLAWQNTDGVCANAAHLQLRADDSNWYREVAHLTSPLSDFDAVVDAQGPALRHRIPDRHLAAGTRRGRRRARLQPAARAARPFRKGRHQRISAIHADHADRPRARALPALRRRARRRHPQAARRHGRQPDLPGAPGRPESQRHRRDPDPRRPAHHHGAALSARRSSPATSASC